MISIIIPTLNGGELFGEVLNSIGDQDLDEKYELLIYDSSSTDDTVARAKAFGAQVIPVRREEFDHGGTRSLAAERAAGDILVFMTQDAVIADPGSLSALIAPLQKESSVDVTYGRQLPAEDATLAAAHLRLFNYPELSMQRSYDDRSKYGLKTVFVSNSFAAYKKVRLAAIGYFQDNLIFGEDTCAVGRLLLHGSMVRYVAEATVFHSHNYTFWEEFKRHFDIGVLHSAEQWLLQEYGRAEGHGASYVHSAISCFVSNKAWSLLPDLIIRCGVKYLGYNLGRKYRYLPEGLRPKCSMHHSWWQR